MSRRRVPCRACQGLGWRRGSISTRSNAAPTFCCCRRSRPPSSCRRRCNSQPGAPLRTRKGSAPSSRWCRSSERPAVVGTFGHYRCSRLPEQSVEEVQLTLSSAPAAAGDETATQLDPFQCSVSPTTLLVAVSSVEPTAQQSSAETQLTPERRLLPAGCGKLEATEAAANPGNTTAGAHAPTASATAARAKPSLPCSEPNGPLSMP